MLHAAEASRQTANSRRGWGEWHALARAHMLIVRPFGVLACMEMLGPRRSMPFTSDAHATLFYTYGFLPKLLVLLSVILIGCCRSEAARRVLAHSDHRRD